MFVNWFKSELMPRGENFVMHPFKEQQFHICAKYIKYLGMFISKVWGNPTIKIGKKITGRDIDSPPIVRR